MLPFSLSILLGYVLGSFPSALVVGKTLRGIDIRTQGSGNLGTSNAIRVLGLGPGMLVFFLDLVKGVLGALGGLLLLQLLVERPADLAAALGLGTQVPVPEAASGAVPSASGLGAASLGSATLGIGGLGTELAVLQLMFLAAGGIGAIVGHIFPLFARFKGGKAVATGTGVVASLLPLGLTFAVPLFFIVLGFSGYVSLGSMLGALSLPFAVLLWYGTGDSPALIRLGLAVVIAVGIVLLHRKNLVRLARGEESRFEKARVLARLFSTRKQVKAESSVGTKPEAKAEPVISPLTNSKDQGQAPKK